MPTSKTIRETRAKRRVKSGWIPEDGSAYVAGREIGGMVYVGRGPRTGRYSQPDNAFIDPSKNVASRGGDYEGQGMDYWPNYSTIDARSVNGGVKMYRRGGVKMYCGLGGSLSP